MTPNYNMSNLLSEIVGGKWSYYTQDESWLRCEIGERLLFDNNNNLFLLLRLNEYTRYVEISEIEAKRVIKKYNNLKNFQ